MSPNGLLLIAERTALVVYQPDLTVRWQRRALDFDALYIELQSCDAHIIIVSVEKDNGERNFFRIQADTGVIL